jgi:hypothetical protein
MKRITKHRISFIVKSLLWSLLLYAVTMVACNWDEIRSGKNSSAVIAGSSTPAFENPQTETTDKNISDKPSLIKIGAAIIHAAMGIGLGQKGR